MASGFQRLQNDETGSSGERHRAPLGFGSPADQCSPTSETRRTLSGVLADTDDAQIDQHEHLFKYSDGIAGSVRLKASTVAVPSTTDFCKLDARVYRPRPNLCGSMTRAQ